MVYQQFNSWYKKFAVLSGLVFVIGNQLVRGIKYNTNSLTVQTVGILRLNSTLFLRLYSEISAI
jgi:hypothetical protein